jgi:hypothetical protein
MPDRAQRLHRPVGMDKAATAAEPTPMLRFSVLLSTQPTAPAQAFCVVDHLVARCPLGASVSAEVNRGGSAAYEIPAEHPLLAAAEQALAATGGPRLLRVRMGATLPMTEIFKRELGIDTVMFSFSFSTSDDN